MCCVTSQPSVWGWVSAAALSYCAVLRFAVGGRGDVGGGRITYMALHAALYPARLLVWLGEVGTGERTSCRIGSRHLSHSSVKGLGWCVHRTAGKYSVGRVGVTAAGPVAETYWGGSSSEPCQREEIQAWFNQLLMTCKWEWHSRINYYWTLFLS